ncbi:MULTISPECIES: glycosyltransferase family 4 protein [unclassified Methanoregula]|uniref:glycosyltransferase family 4 protein n=1 Tax=unclassified Methanoregula TaxID=2649730 RepID=UPI0009CFBECD|nr:MULTISPECIES: glycosyltransferase family 4 protein [unclassified Methanoregula]OPX63687.1 MAG: Trehalose synthase [Methanoregula sp. PtaB.Bin085]OPY36146.1 MAG: Trehalose synthase [Methanoregula sp. PtaU1.Bin006]
MRIVLIADGRSIHTLRWAEYFAGRGHEVHLITYDPINRTLPGVTEHVLESFWKNLYLAFIPRQLAIQKLVKTIRPDIIHAHFIAKYGFHIPGLNFRPAIVSAWGDDILILPRKSRLISWYTKKVLNTVDLVYAVSQNIRDHVISDFSIPESKVRYLPFGIDTNLFRPKTDPAPEEQETIRVFSNRGFYPVYDNMTLVRGFALAYQKNPALRLTLKGDGPQEDEVRRLVTDLGLDPCVTFRKRTGYSEVPRDYREADIFITTSVSDGTPVSVLEAMASGLPCIATSVGGIPEWIENGVTGLLVMPGSPEQVADAILSLVQDPILRKRLGDAAKGVIVRNGQWDTLMAQAEKDYLALVETYRQDRP